MNTSVPTTRPPGDGWLTWSNPYGTARREPYDYAEVEVWREGFTQTHLQDPHNCNPYMNVQGLYWRPAGPLLTEKAKLEKAVNMVLRRRL